MRVFNNIKYHWHDSELLSDNSNLKSIILRTEQSNNQFSNTNSIYLRIFTSNEKTFFISAIGWYENPKLHSLFCRIFDALHRCRLNSFTPKYNSWILIWNGHTNGSTPSWAYTVVPGSLLAETQLAGNHVSQVERGTAEETEIHRTYGQQSRRRLSRLARTAATQNGSGPRALFAWS